MPGSVSLPTSGTREFQVALTPRRRCVDKRPGGDTRARLQSDLGPQLCSPQQCSMGLGLLRTLPSGKMTREGLCGGPGTGLEGLERRAAPSWPWEGPHGPPMTYLGWLPPVLAELQRGGGKTPGWEARGPQLSQKEAPPPPPSRASCRPLPSARIIHHVFPKPCQVLGSLLAE